jgi:DNA-binding SARP family transcriptional activator
VDALRLVVPNLSEDLMVASSRVGGPNTDRAAQVEATAAALADAVDAALRRTTVLVLDDLDEIDDGSDAASLLSAFVRQAPARLHIVLACRDRPPFGVARLLAHRDAVELGATDLAFSTQELTELAEAVLGSVDQAAAAAVRRLTGGWPVASRLAVEAIALAPAGGARQQVIDGLAEPHGVLLDYITEEVIGRETRSVLDVLSRAEPLAALEPGLAQAIGIPDAEVMLRQVTDRGVYLTPVSPGSARVALAPIFRSYIARHRRLPDPDRDNVLSAAAHWHEAAGEPAHALGYWIQLGSRAACRRILTAHGDDLAAAGQAPSVVQAADLIPAHEMTPALHVVVGDAQLLLGDWDAALRSYGQASDRGGPVPARVAWRVGLLHYIRGDLDSAVKAFDSAVGDDTDPAAWALVLGWSATVRWIRGDMAGCRLQAAEAIAAARKSGDARALACAHTVLAMLAAFDGDREANDVHYLHALDHASAARDVFQLVRIHSNRASLHLEMGDFESALVEVDLALKLADLAGFAFPRGVALSNRGRALIALGRLDEARAELDAARTTFERLDSPMASYPYTALGDLHRLRGDRLAAESAYERAIGLAGQVGDTQGLVPALAGMARLLTQDEPDRAREAAARALGVGASLGRVEALLAHALSAETADETAARAEAAAAEARAQRDQAGLAEAWEIAASARADPALMRQAIALWQDLRNPIGAARAKLALAALDQSPRSATQARQAMRHAVSLGALSLAEPTNVPPPAVSMQCLGGFAVLRDGEPVPASAWQSRKARDLLKFLVCRRGRSVHREQLAEVLWPDEDPAKTANRLSVALSTVRATLDPAHRHPPDHYVAGDGDAVALRTEHVDVDVEMFLAGAAAALARPSDDLESWEDLSDVESMYVGDVFEDDPYPDWTVDLREKARLTYLDVARTLAALANQAGDHDAQARYTLRILERDPYDEPAHLSLIALLARDGRHGEARRRYRLYSRQMEEIGVEAAPYP